MKGQKTLPDGSTCPFRREVDLNDGKGLRPQLCVPTCRLLNKRNSCTFNAMPFISAQEKGKPVPTRLTTEQMRALELGEILNAAGIELDQIVRDAIVVNQLRLQMGRNRQMTVSQEDIAVGTAGVISANKVSQIETIKRMKEPATAEEICLLQNFFGSVIRPELADKLEPL